MELRAFKIPPLALLVTVGLLAVGELACGTGVYFVLMMVITMLCIGITYNQLGGLSTFSGILFSGFAARTIVISQFAKVILFEAADKNLEVPQLTITIYAVFYFSAMLGALLFGRTRIALPKAREPRTDSERSLLYFISVTIGIGAVIVYEIYTQSYGGSTEYTTARSWALNLSYLLLFSQVLAVDARIRQTAGRHSFNWAAFIPWLVASTIGFVDTVRTAIIAPTIVYFATCYLRRYSFHWRHFAALGIGIVAFYSFISPLEIYTRPYIANMGLGDRIYTSFHMATELPSREGMEASVADFFIEEDPREQYFGREGTFTLSRFSVIRADSTLISACSGGFHYGLAQIKEDAPTIIPRFLVRNKVQVPETNYIANVSGLGADAAGAQPVISAVADSYGAFGWWGVVLYPLLAMSAIYIVYESIFDISGAWGTVALGVCFLLFSEMSVGRIFPILIRQPLNLIVISNAFVLLARFFPYRADNFGLANRLFDPSSSLESADSGAGLD